MALYDLYDYLFHIDSYLITFISSYGSWIYSLVFLIIFCETGLIVLPFLPGDSLLFAIGSLAALPQQVSLNINLLFIFLLLASILGNQLNYFIGKWLGTKSLLKESNYFINKKYLERTQDFYKKHGGKTIIMARFLPIIRTFAPFVAGIGNMNGYLFFLYNFLSATLWIGSLLFSGYFMGRIPFINQNFSLVIYAIIAFSILPSAILSLYHKILLRKKIDF